MVFSSFLSKRPPDLMTVTSVIIGVHGGCLGGVSGYLVLVATVATPAYESGFGFAHRNCAGGDCIGAQVVVPTLLLILFFLLWVTGVKPSLLGFMHCVGSAMAHILPTVPLGVGGFLVLG